MVEFVTVFLGVLMGLTFCEYVLRPWIKPVDPLARDLGDLARRVRRIEDFLTQVAIKYQRGELK